MKTTISRPISTRQIQALQSMLRGIGLTDRDERLEYISSQIGRSIGSTKELTSDEAWRLLLSLNEGSDKAKELLRKEAANVVGDIYHLSFLIPFLNEDYSENNTPEDKEMNKAKISVWTRKYAECHKAVSQMDVNELKAVRKQMHRIINNLEKKGE